MVVAGSWRGTRHEARPIKEARLAREKAEQLPPGEEREGLRVGGDIREFRKLFPAAQ